MLMLSVLTVVASIVCAIAWLLSLGAIGTDQCAGSDAMSRGISYVLSHKVYSAAVCFASILISSFAMLLTQWGITTGLALVESTIRESGSVASELKDFSTVLLIVFPNAVQLGVLLSAMTIAYLLLRQKEDAIHLQELDGGKPQHTQ